MSKHNKLRIYGSAQAAGFSIDATFVDGLLKPINRRPCVFLTANAVIIHATKSKHSVCVILPRSSEGEYKGKLFIFGDFIADIKKLAIDALHFCGTKHSIQELWKVTC